MLLAPWSLLAQSPASLPPASAGASADETVVLSPFTVESGSEKGYLATQTLSGTRLKTDLRDIGSALTIFTEQMMNDLAATNINDVLAFAPNTDPFVNTLTDAVGNGNNFLNVPVQYVTRGGATSVVGQDFFGNNIPPDRYNAEAFTFTRGPNAILFGLGNPAGAFVSSTKRANAARSGTTVELRIDSRDSYRGVLDHNQVLKQGVLAVRYAGVYDVARSFRNPSENFQRRHFVTTRYTPFKTTTLRINYEQGELKTMAVRPWPVYDGLSTWLAAGSPLVPTLTAARPAGTQNGYGTAQLVSTQFSPAGTVVPTLNFLNQSRSAVPAYPAFPSVSGKRSLNDPSVFPVEANVIGFGSFRLTNFKTGSAFIEQQLTKNWFLEAAINKVRNKTKAANAFIGDFDRVFADVNQVLPNGAANPNVGRIYAESYSTVIPAPSESLSRRLMTSYELDFSRQKSPWLKHLGRHRAAAFLENAETKGWSSNLATINVTPAAPFPAAITNNGNRVNFRYYLDPSAGIVSAGRDNTVAFPLIYANTPLPARDPSGVTIAYVNQNGGTASSTFLGTQAAALQSSFWNSRLILTNGWREDTQRVWRASPADFAPWQDARGVFPDPALFDIRRHFPLSRRESGGKTYTRGLVFHATRWLSLTYNQSNNFQANDSSRSVFGELLPNPEGKGKDYGLKFSFFDQRLFAELTYYENFSNRKIDGSISTGVAGPFSGDINGVWNAIATFTGDTRYNEFPYAAGFNTWQDSTSGKSTGWEFSLTANPTKQWRLNLNGSKRGYSETTERGTNIKRYLALNVPLWRAHPEWLALPIAATAETVGSRVTRLEQSLGNLNAIQSLPEDVYAPSWSINFIQTYAFAPGSRLAGFSVGASGNVRGPAVNGFAEGPAPSFTLIPDKPFKTPTAGTYGAWVTYGRKILRDRIDWRLQLNVRNLLDENTVFPLRTVDARDGSNRGVVATWRLNEPRTYTLTSTFKF